MCVLPYPWKLGLRWQSCAVLCRLQMAIPDISGRSFGQWQIQAIMPNGSEIDISSAVLSQLKAEGRSVFAAADLAKLFAQKTAPKFVRIANAGLADWRELRVRFGAPFEIDLNAKPLAAQAKTRIVYFINCYINKNYIYLFSRQMADLAESGLLTGTACTLYVVSSGAPNDKQVLKREIERIVGDSDNIVQEHTEKNLYEYPGIHKVWQLGKQDSDAFILYFHARGISRIKLGRFRRNRQPLERRLFRRVITEWRKNLLWLTAVRSADKVGISHGGNGWIWFNFWWARASHIAHLEEPEQTERRHYYEDWLGRYARSAAGEYANTLDRCISIAYSERRGLYNIGSDFHPDRGETYLGLPGYWPRIVVFRLKRLLA